MKSFSYLDRKRFLHSFAEEFYDLAVIGGGITGAGVARDAASRGMKVALIEARDFASGTSSRSSKLIHGGIRYLENMEFGLVFEALRERRLLTEIAPHLVHPLRFLLPLYRGDRVGMGKMGLGMWLYDALALFESDEMHERLNAETTVNRVPTLNKQSLLGSYVYSDAYMDDDRLVLETLRSAEELGAHCVSYVKATQGIFAHGALHTLIGVDQQTGENVQIKAKHFVSTVGPWTDQLGKILDSSWKKIMAPTKGVHLTFPLHRLPLSCAVVMAANRQERIIFAIPRKDMVIVGTTDTPYSEDPSTVHTQSQDVKYLLQVLNDYFPGACLSANDILASYAGVRPLVDDGSNNAGRRSREHLIFRHSSGVTFVTGGKYTTYRHMAEQTVRLALSSFSLEDRIKFSRSQTQVPLNSLISSESYRQSFYAVKDYSKEWSINESIISQFIFRYGREAEKLIAYYLETSPDLDPTSRMWQAEAIFSIHNTMCFHLRDFIFRRTPFFLSRLDHGREWWKQVAHIFAVTLGWNNAKQEEEWNMLMEDEKKELNWRHEFSYDN